MWRLSAAFIVASLGVALSECDTNTTCGCLCDPVPDGSIIAPCSAVGPPVDFDAGDDSPPIAE